MFTTSRSSWSERPAQHVAIAASHEIQPSPAAAVAKSVGERVRRRRLALEHERRGLRRCLYVENTCLKRSIEGGVDDLKLLYPVLDNIPVVAFALVHFAATGSRVAVYGSPEVGRVVEVVRAYLLAEGVLPSRDHLLFVEEDKSDLSYYHAFEKPCALLEAGPRDAIVWSAADLILAYNVYPWLLEPAVDEYDLVVNMMARELAFPAGAPEFFRRNYYDFLELTDPPGRVVEVKQPDLLVFTPGGLRGLVELDRLRARKEKGIVGHFLRRHWKSLLRPGVGSILRTLRYGLVRRKMEVTRGRALHQDDASVAVSLFFGVKTLVTATVGDPFVIKDGDSFEDLFGFFKPLLQGVVDAAPTRREGYRRLAAFHPHAEHLYALSRRLRPLRDEIPLWRVWPELIRDRIATFNHHLKVAFHEAELGAPVLVPEFFAADGTFRTCALPQEDLEAARAFLAGPYLQGYGEGRRRHAAGHR